MSTKRNKAAGADSPSVIERVLDHPFFSGMTSNDRALIATAIEPGAAREARYGRDEIIFREKEKADRFYLLEKGDVQIEVCDASGDVFPIQTLKAGDVLGFSWMFGPFKWRFQARSLGPSTVIVLNGNHLLLNAERHRNFGYDLMKRVAQIAIERLQATRVRYVATSLEMEAASLKSGRRRASRKTTGLRRVAP